MSLWVMIPIGIVLAGVCLWVWFNDPGWEDDEPEPKPNWPYDHERDDDFRG